MSQSEDTIRRRIDQLGLTEPVVAPYGQGENEIIVELPGEGDPIRAKSVIQAGGQLEIRLVEDANPYPSEAAALAAHNGVLPPNTEIAAGQASVQTPERRAGQAGMWLDRVPIDDRARPAQRRCRAQHGTTALLRK